MQRTRTEYEKANDDPFKFIYKNKNLREKIFFVVQHRLQERQKELEKAKKILVDELDRQIIKIDNKLKNKKNIIKQIESKNLFNVYEDYYHEYFGYADDSIVMKWAYDVYRKNIKLGMFQQYLSRYDLIKRDE